MDYQIFAIYNVCRKYDLEKQQIEKAIFYDDIKRSWMAYNYILDV